MSNLPTLEVEIPLHRDRDSAASDRESLFETHFEAIYRYLSRRVFDQEDAKDLTAETFVASIQHQCPRGVDARCWLYGIARRKLADLRRKQKRRPDLERLSLLEDERKENESRSAELRALIAHLPRHQREALMLQALEDLSISEIAQVMGRSQGSVKALLQRAKERVRHQSQTWNEPLEDL